MINKYWITVLAHTVTVGIALKLLNFILPKFLIAYYTWICHLLLFVLIARYSLAYTKRRYLNSHVKSKDKAVIITGCDSGFGNFLARRLDAKGFHVFASCLLPEGEGAQTLKEDCSQRLHVFGMDVTKDDSVKDATQYVKDNLGTCVLWALVNNAGVHRGTAVELSSVDDYKSCIEVNSIGMVRTTKSFLPLLRRSKGRLINLASYAGRIAMPYFSPYCMSKFAAVAFSECLRYELDVWGVTVIQIEPELFQTQLTSSEAVTSCMDVSFGTIHDSVREDYGPRFIKAFRSYVNVNLKISSPKLHKVLDALESAVTLEYPDLVYHPCRNTFTQFILHLLNALPSRLQCIIIRSLICLSRFPNPDGLGKMS